MAQYVVIGLGRFGMAASIELIRLGNTVIGIDTSEKLVQKASDELTLAIVADGSDEQSLREIDISGSDTVLVAIGESLEASLLCVLQLQSLNVKDIWVKATTKPHHDILSKLGVSRIIHPEEEMGVRVAQSINYPMVNQYMPLGFGIFLVELQIVDHFDQTKVIDLIKRAKNEIKPLLVRRGEDLITPVELDFTLCKQDSLVMSGTLDSLKKITPELHK